MQDTDLHIQLKNDVKQEVVLPCSIVKALLTLLVEMSEGKRVALIPQQEELTTQEAADLLHKNIRKWQSTLQNGWQT